MYNLSLFPCTLISAVKKKILRDIVILYLIELTSPLPLCCFCSLMSKSCKKLLSNLSCKKLREWTGK